ncbi:MAG: aminoglycoside phosphotransferase family protein [Phormidesmis sp.]
MTCSLVQEGTPSPEIEVDKDLVRALLKEQHCDLAEHPIQPMGSRWDNAMFRLGETMTVRLPRRKAAVNLIEHEQTWLPRLANRLTLPAPVPLRVGNPSVHYPWQWSVLPWIDGETADVVEPNHEQAARFGVFLRSLHILAPSTAPSNPFRGMSLLARSPQTQPVLESLEIGTSLITPRIKQIWQQALEAPTTDEKRWLHGDLHPHNVLVKDKIISGVIDWGDMTSGDVATDLAAVWMLFLDVETRKLALSQYGASKSEIVRAKGGQFLSQRFCCIRD